MSRTVTFIFAALLLVEPAHAQIVRPPSRVDRSFDISAALALNGINNVNARPLCDELAFPCSGRRSFPDVGGAVSVAGYFDQVFGLVFDVGVYKEHWEAPAGTLRPAGPQVNTILSFGFGPRVSLPGWNDRTRVFAQVLLGARMSNAVEGSNVIQPGGGIDVRTPIGMKLRFEVDYAIMRGAPPTETSNAIRMTSAWLWTKSLCCRFRRVRTRACRAVRSHFRPGSSGYARFPVTLGQTLVCLDYGPASPGRVFGSPPRTTTSGSDGTPTKRRPA